MKYFLVLLSITSAILVAVNSKFLVYFLVVYGMFLVGRIKPNFRIYIITYVLLEELAAYSIGGGLHGTATSLLDDYIHSVPIFLVHFYLWRGYECDKVLYLAGSQGLFWEIILPGAFTPAALILVPPVMAIYGRPAMIYAEEGNCNRWPFKRIKILLAEITVGIAVAILFP